jgi:uncharacterized protein (TIRG00374 family)
MDTRIRTAPERAEAEPSARLIPRERMLRGVVTFIVLTAAGIGSLYWFTARGQAHQVLRSLSVPFIALAMLGAAADILIGAERYQIFLRRIRPGTPLWLPIRADLANRFVGAITPSQTGGGPAQVYVLWRGGIPVPDALSFLLINFLSTLIFFLAAGGFAAWIFRERFPDGAIHLLVLYGFAAFATCLGVMLVGLFRPDWVARPMAWAARRLEGRPEGIARALHHSCDLLARSLDRYRQACTRFIREDPLLPIQSFVLTAVLYLNKFTLAWLVMRGLGVDGDYLTCIAVQALLHFILYVAPSPGGSGIAEVGTGALMAILLPTRLLAPFTLAYRFFLLYLPATAGAVVLLRALHPREATSRRSLRAVAVAAATASTPGPGAASTSVSVHTPTRVAAGRVALVLAATLALGAGHLVAQSGPAGSIWSAYDDAPARIEALVVRGIEVQDADSAKVLFAKSVTLARDLVADDPGDADAHYLLSVALGYDLEHQGLRTKLRMAGEVRREAERALEIDPHHPGAHHVLGRLNAAAMRLNRVARLIARKVLGASVLEGASWEQAEYHFREAWKYDPTSPRHAMELGALYIDTHRPEMARAVLEEAVRLRPTEASDSLAEARARVLLQGLPPE